MGRTRGILLGCTCLLLLSCATEPAPALKTPPLEEYGGIGGDFSLKDQYGAAFDLQALRGRPILLFFGYTFCPDICPVTLSKVSQVHEILGTSEADLATVFITVDPERDTQDKLTEYLDYFGSGIFGLHGSKEETDLVIGQYGGHYSLNKEEGVIDYSVDHSTSTYLLDQNGKVRFLFGQSDDPKIMAAVTGQLLPH
jgi:protein SCO1/2